MTNSEDPYISYQHLVDHLDLQKGDILYVASDILRLIRISVKNESEFNPDLFIESLQNKIGREGTLVFPAFTFNLKSGDSFDQKKTPPITGALSVTAFKRKDFKRTFHPLHSFLVWGNFSDALVGLRNQSSFSADSPFHFLVEKKSKMLAIDLDLQGAFTFAHYVEEKEKVFYRYWKKMSINYVDRDGKAGIQKVMMFKKFPGFVNDLTQMTEKFRNENALSESKLNDVNFMLVPIDKAVDILIQEVRKNNASGLYRFRFDVFFRDIIKSVLGK